MTNDDRAPRPAHPGPLIATGRAADVFDLGAGRVLRRYRERRHRPEHEARVMRYVAEHGIDVPRVFDLAAAHDPELDIVMEHIDGPTMYADLQRRPWKALFHARLLVRLQQRIAAVPAPSWMMSPGWETGSSGHVDSVLHLDLHPLNVLLARRGPVIIDWTNATGGPAGFDPALSYTLMATYETTTPRDRIAQQALVGAFKRFSGPRTIDAFLLAACDHRLADRGVTPGERVNIGALRAQVLARSG